MKIAIALFDGCYASSFTGPQDVFNIANFFSPLQRPAFDVHLIADGNLSIKVAGGGRFSAEEPLGEQGAYDLIYVPSFPYIDEAAFDRLVSENAPLLAWLGRAWVNGVTLAASCTATFLLAETGLLNRRRATTTWWLERQFRRRYPLVLLDRRAILTSEDRLMCAGAMTSSLNLAIEIVAQHGAPELATKCARSMMIDTSRQVQPFLQGAILKARCNHPVVQRAQHWLQTHMHDTVELSKLAERLGVSSRSLNRHFRHELSMTPLQYLQSMRVEQAKLLLEQTRLPIAQIVEDVGYSDVRSFTSLFCRQVGITPSAYRVQVAGR